MWEAPPRNALGAKFRRQHVNDSFVVDFLCIAANLVIEVDGPIHTEQAEYDASREEHLRPCGYRVLRFSNDQVERDLPQVLEQIPAALWP